MPSEGFTWWSLVDHVHSLAALEIGTFSDTLKFLGRLSCLLRHICISFGTYLSVCLWQLQSMNFEIP